MKIMVQHDAVEATCEMRVSVGDYILVRGSKAVGVVKRSEVPEEQPTEAIPKNATVVEEDVLRVIHEHGPMNAYHISSHLGIAPNDRNTRTVVQYVLKNLTKKMALSASDRARPVYSIKS